MNAIVTEVLTWLGTPYHHAGRIKGAGVDCAMLLCEVYERCGLTPHIVPEYYPMDWALHRGSEVFLSWVEKYGHRVDNPQAGDVVLYRYGRCVSHGGIVVEWPQIIHADRPTGKVTLAEGDKGQLGERLYGFYRIGVNDVR